jgi:uncharacterized membrane protein YbhN (UPF0104 family)
MVGLAALDPPYTRVARRKAASAMNRFLLAVRGFVTSKRFLSCFGHLLVLLVFTGAARLLYVELNKPEYSVANIKDGLRWIAVKHPWRIIIASLLTVLNFVILVGYDWFAVRYVGEKKLPLRKIALASFITYAFSLNFGASLFGTSIRYRLYSVWGVPLVKIVELLVILGLTFWFGVFTLAGVIFTVAPFKVPATLVEELKIIPFHHTFWVGILLLMVSGSYVLLSALCREPIRLWRWKIPVPPLKLTLCQIVIACGDLIVAAAVLYTLLPPVEGGYVRVLGVWMLAYVGVVISHVPGGYGFQEWVVLAFCPGHRVAAALIVFRVIYYWVPLAIASALLGGHELVTKNGAGTDSGTVPTDK